MRHTSPRDSCDRHPSCCKGTLVLTRGEDGLITKYREIWDVTVAQSLKTVYL
jgi:hypothetical protein